MIRVCFFEYSSTKPRYYRKLCDLLQSYQFTAKEVASIRNRLNRKRKDGQGYKADIWRKNGVVIQRHYFEKQGYKIAHQHRTNGVGED